MTTEPRNNVQGDVYEAVSVVDICVRGKKCIYFSDVAHFSCVTVDTLNDSTEIRSAIQPLR
jgi:hypothetical protein